MSLFTENCYKTLDECQKILGDRAGQYDKHADSWRDFPFTAVKMAMRLLGLPEIPQDRLRLIASAAMVDLKISRMVGDYKQDTFVDLINYALNLDAEMQRVKTARENAEKALESQAEGLTYHRYDPNEECPLVVHHQPDWRPSSEAPDGVMYDVRVSFGGKIVHGRGYRISADSYQWSGVYEDCNPVMHPDEYDAKSGKPAHLVLVKK